MNKEIHFWSFCPKGREVYMSFDDTAKAIRDGVEHINTTSMVQLCFELQSIFKYDIYIHDSECPEGYLVSYDERQCSRANRELREGHDICDMWLAGEFSGETFKEG